MNKIAIYCVTYHSYEAADRYLRSLDALAGGASDTTLSVFIADNTDTHAQQNIGYHPRNYSMQVFPMPKNLGYFGAVGNMMEQASPLGFDYTIISNVDLGVDERFFHLLSSLHVSPDVGWVAPQIYSQSEQRDKNPKILSRYPEKKLSMLRFLFRHPFLYHLYTSTLYRRKKFRHHAAMDIYAGHGSFIILTKTYFEECGIIRYPVFLFCEEIYLGEECRAHRLRVRYEPQLKVFDQEHVSTGQFKGKQYCALNHQALTFVLDKYYRRMKRNTIICPMLLAAASLLPCPALAQYAWQQGEGEPSRLELARGLEYRVEAQGLFSRGKTPLWLNANKHGLSSLETTNGYLRGALLRPLVQDSARRWGVGYGLDVAATHHYTSRWVVQQAFAEVRWLHGVLSVGAKEYPMELKNQTLSSGSQTLGINARPVPQVRLALPEYWTPPILHGWLQLKGHVAYGKMTDQRWQHEFTQRKSKYADGVLYHSKAGYLRIGNEGYFCPWSVELGLEMAAQFGGTPYASDGKGGMTPYPTQGGLKGMWQAFVPGGQDASDGAYKNVAGNQLGSWLARVNYDADSWRLALYADHFFEDHSQMFLLDYDGYGEGAEWQRKKSRRFFMYSLKDMMVGLELNVRYGRWIRDVVLEYIHTKYQSGPYNHDHTMNIPDHVAGMDDYYNHSHYTGWQHWGQVMGNPLYRSPLYNADGTIQVRDNRFVAYHLGIDGQPTERLGYRALATYQKGWGTYVLPFTKMHHNVSFLVEGDYQLPRGWNVKAAYGMDFGSEQMLGHNAGFQLTVSKRGLLRRP